MKKTNKSIFLLFVVLLFVASMAIPASASEKTPTEELRIVYFYSSKCLACKENEDYIERLGGIAGVDLIKYNVDQEDCSAIQCAYANHYGVADVDALIVPYIYFGDLSYNLSPSNHNEVTRMIDDYLSGRKTFVNFEYEDDMCPTSIFEKLMDKMTISGVLLAGFLDGINPCAISMLMVFFSFLLCTGDKRKTLYMASLFILGVFIANFLFGLGVKTFYDLFAGNTAILLALYIIAIQMCIIAITLNVIDIANRKNPGSVKNQLPDRIKFKLSSIMRSSVFSKAAIPAAFAVGFLIGVVELACTGQIYLPTLTYMIASNNETIKSITLLILYNIMFVLPLIIITVIAAVLQKPEEIKSAIMKKNHVIKAVAIIFFSIMLLILIREVMSIV